MSSDGNLEVWIRGVRVGTLRKRASSGAFAFVPDADWIEQGGIPLFSLKYKQSGALKNASSGLPRWFEHLLPPQSGVLRGKIAAKMGMQTASSAWLLSIIGRDLPGAVIVSGSPEAETLPAAPTDEMRPFRFSLAGMQLKFSMEAVGQRFSVPGSGALGRWIVKIPGANRPELPQVEWATMEWARMCGLPVPECQVVSSDRLEGLGPSIANHTKFVYAVRRFDRRDSGERVHQEDFAQLLDIDVDGRSIYGQLSAGNISYDSLLLMVQDLLNEEGITDFVRRVAFVIASGNDDAHLKNWGILWPNPQLVRPELCPCYDHVCTIAWEDFGWKRHRGPMLALRFGGVEHFARVGKQEVEKWLKRARGDRWADSFYEGLQSAKNTWSALRPHAPEAMVRAVTEHWENVPLLRHVGPLPQ